MDKETYEALGRIIEYVERNAHIGVLQRKDIEQVKDWMEEEAKEYYDEK